MVKIQNNVKAGKTGCVCVLECSLYAPCYMDVGVCCTVVGFRLVKLI